MFPPQYDHTRSSIPLSTYRGMTEVAPHVSDERMLPFIGKKRSIKRAPSINLLHSTGRLRSMICERMVTGVINNTIPKTKKLIEQNAASNVDKQIIVNMLNEQATNEATNEETTAVER